MSAIHARKKPFLRLATAAVTMITALGVVACSGGAPTPSSSPSNAQVGNRSPEQIKEAGETAIGIFFDKVLFGYIDADNKPTGCDVVYGGRIAADLGVTAKCAPVDATARTEILASNKINIILVNFTVMPEHAEKVDFVNPYFRVSPGVVSPTSAEIANVSQLADKTFIVTRGVTTEAYSEASHPEVKLQKYDQYSGTYQALEGGRGDAFSTDNTEIVAWTIQHPGLSVGIKSLGETSYITTAVKKGNTALLDRLSNQLVELDQENFLHKGCKQTLASIYGNAAIPDDFVVEGGVDTTSTN